MNIGILTQPLTTNYGGILQCYALQKYLKDAGHNVIVLNRKVKPSILDRLKEPIRWIKYIYDGSVKGRLAIKKFIKDKINITEPIYTSAKLYEVIKKLGINGIIVGSDQVWRECYSPNIEDYFAGFIPDDYRCLKIAYSASFGTSNAPISDFHLKKCIKLAQKFDAISVREEFGIELLNRRFGINATLTIDPTLMLSTNEYKRLYDEKHYNGLISYILDETEEKERIISNIAQDLSLAEHKIRTTARKLNKNTINTPPIETWLNLFAKADIIVTDSFHGCVFSILHKKPFIAIANKERGIERFTTLLGKFDISNRLIYNYEDYQHNKSLLLRQINYNKVEELLQKEISKSNDFINNSITLNNTR